MCVAPYDPLDSARSDKFARFRASPPSNSCQERASLRRCSATRADMLRVLLYGDSLIAGYHHFSGPVVSWAPHLEGHLGKALKRPVEVVAHGQGGLTASAMRSGPGLRKLLGGKRFDLVVIHAGANDFMQAGGWEEGIAGTIVADVAALHATARQAGSKTASLGIPLGPGVGDREGLTQLNDGIASGGGADLFFDTTALMPYAQNAQLWSTDGVHFTHDGYVEWARRMAGPLATLLRGSPKGSGGHGSGRHSNEESQPGLGTEPHRHG